MSDFELLREPVLGQAECAAVVDELLKLRPLWTSRAGSLPFFTFGAASYLDGMKVRSHYWERATACNPMLLERFGWLLERSRRVISARLGLQVEWFPRAALPGFHIYLAHDIFALPVASIHYDLQYRALDLSNMADVGVDEPVSFTLPVSLPTAGGGLNTWEKKFDREGEVNSISRADIAGIRPKRHLYHLGEMVLHSGHMLHQAAPAAFAHPDERRITLQGHGIRADGRLYLYW
jgi:hypothetical protein